ncbi:protein adg3 precursor [Penicillium verhagenii]|uniref:protein adg3 precursor n=1 Tax=Penicillium verhagenii TaxID=1562060 RepID=UPI0025452A36|nr:protein adg3 precursor [Penicillium verhagenii]KAJ5930903.1 protein adg3 precursor [Penicillium verhagenii]
MMRLSFLLALVASTTAVPTPDPIQNNEEEHRLEHELVELLSDLPKGRTFCREFLDIPCDVISTTEWRTVTVVEPTSTITDSITSKVTSTPRAETAYVTITSTDHSVSTLTDVHTVHVTDVVATVHLTDSVTETIVTDLTSMTTDTFTLSTTATVTDITTETITQSFTNTATEYSTIYATDSIFNTATDISTQFYTNYYTETDVVSLTETVFATDTQDITTTQTSVPTTTQTDQETVTDMATSTSISSVTSTTTTVLTDEITATTTTLVSAAKREVTEPTKVSAPEVLVVYSHERLSRACHKLDLKPETSTKFFTATETKTTYPTAAGGARAVITKFITIWETITAPTPKHTVTRTDITTKHATTTLHVLSTKQTDVSLTTTDTVTVTATVDDITTVTDSTTVDVTAWATTVLTEDVTTDQTLTATTELSTTLTNTATFTVTQDETTAVTADVTSSTTQSTTLDVTDVLTVTSTSSVTVTVPTTVETTVTSTVSVTDVAVVTSEIDVTATQTSSTTTTTTVTATATCGVNLVQNGNFATGSFADWTTSGSGSTVEFLSGSAIGETYMFYYVGVSPATYTISQSVATVAGTTYTVSFWWRDGTTTASLIVSLGSTSETYKETSNNLAVWTKESFTYEATSSSSELVFEVVPGTSSVGFQFGAISVEC